MVEHIDTPHLLAGDTRNEADTSRWQETFSDRKRARNPNPTSVDQTFNMVGVLINSLVTPGETGHEVSLFKSTLPLGVVIPLHSHAEPEVFYVLEGSPEVYRERASHKDGPLLNQVARDSRQSEARVSEYLFNIDNCNSCDATRTLRLLPLGSEALRGWDG